MRFYKGILSTLLTGLLLIGVAACEKEGPAEQAGKAIDEAASDVAAQAEETKQAIEEQMDK